MTHPANCNPAQQHQGIAAPDGVPVASGFGTAELLVALAISGVLVAGALSVVTAVGSGRQTNETLSRQVEAAQVGLNQIADDVRRAGMTGCSASTNPALLAGVAGSNGAAGSSPVSGDYAVWFFSQPATTGGNLNLYLLNAAALGLVSLSLVGTDAGNCFQTGGLLNLNLLQSNPSLPNQTVATEWYVAGADNVDSRCGGGRGGTLYRIETRPSGTTQLRSCRAVADGVRSLRVEYMLVGQTAFGPLPASNRAAIRAARLTLEFDAGSGQTRQATRVIALRRSIGMGA